MPKDEATIQLKTADRAEMGIGKPMFVVQHAFEERLARGSSNAIQRGRRYYLRERPSSLPKVQPKQRS